MRGSSRALPKYRKHRPSGQAVVTLNGKDIYLGPHGTKTSHVEYDRLIQEWLAHGRRLPSAVEEQSISIVELCSEYWIFAQSYYVNHGKPTDEIASLRIALRFLRENYGRIAAVEFGPLALEFIRNRMIETGNSRGYINGNINRIRRMFRWAVQRELVPPSTYQALASLPGLRKGKTLARETDPIQPVSFEIISKTIKQATPIAQTGQSGVAGTASNFISSPRPFSYGSPAVLPPNPIGTVPTYTSNVNELRELKKLVALLIACITGAVVGCAISRLTPSGSQTVAKANPSVRKAE